MKKCKKGFCMCMVILVSCLVIGTTAFAAAITTTYSYNDVGVLYHNICLDTPQKNGMSMTWSTRPTSGQSGVMIRVTNNSTGLSQVHTFPYQVSVDPWKISLEKGKPYLSEIRANSGTASGNAKKVIEY